ncbi:MAG: FecR domain-containing protein, partial [Solirubrobacteraceae bacterium]
MLRLRVRRWSAAAGAIAAVLAVGVGTAWGSSSSDAIPVKVTFAATGSASIDSGYTTPDGSCSLQSEDSFPLSWEADFSSTVVDGTLAPATGTLAGAPGSFSFSATSSGQELCDQVAPIEAPPCSGELSATGPPTLAVNGAGGGGTGPQELEIAPIPGLTYPSCAVPELPEHDFAIFNVSLPGAATGEVTIPAGSLVEGQTFTTPVSSGSAPTQMSGDCLGVGQATGGAVTCTQSLSWSGTLTVKLDCGPGDSPTGGAAAKVSSQAGPVQGINPDGTVTPGQTISTGPGGRVELTMPDGSLIRIGPNSKLQVQPCTTADDQGQEHLTFKLLLGEMWADVCDTLGCGPDVETDRAVAG